MLGQRYEEFSNFPIISITFSLRECDKIEKLRIFAAGRLQALRMYMEKAQKRGLVRLCDLILGEKGGRTPREQGFIRDVAGTETGPN